MAISAALQEVYGANPDGVYYIQALSITHSALTAPLHFTNWSQEFTGHIEDSGTARFKRMPFELQWPTKDTEGTQSVGISISNATRGLMQAIRQMTDQPSESAVFHVRVYLTSQTDVNGVYIQQLDPAMQYEVAAISVEQTRCTMSATKLNSHNRQFPRMVYRPDLFPGLSR